MPFDIFSMISPTTDKHKPFFNTGLCISFTDADVFFASVTDSEKLRIPGLLVQRCGLLSDIVGQHDSSEHEIPIQVRMQHAKSWLRCAELGDDSDWVKHDDDTLLGALKVSDISNQVRGATVTYVTHMIYAL